MGKILMVFVFGLVLLACKESRCSNGEQNKKEDGIDCGGPCEPCGTCSDGVKNQDEEEIDCGGTCAMCDIKYPAQGHYGVNVLDETTTHFLIDTQYSQHAELPNGTSLKVVITNTSADIGSTLWFYNGGSEINLIISAYNESTGVQTFESEAEAAEVDLNMSFGGMGGGPGSAIVDIYENESATPTRTKNITW